MDRKLKSILAAGLAALFASAVVAAPEQPATPLAAEQSQDGAITARVKEAFAADAAFAASDISIETVQGEVRLNGTVASAADVHRATAIAFGIAGVQKVQNNLKAK